MLYVIATLAKINFVVTAWRWKEPFIEAVMKDGHKVCFNPNFIETIAEVTKDEAESVLAGKRLVNVETKVKM